MKNISKWIAMAAFLATALWSCKKDENIDYYTAGTSPVLTASDTALKFVPADSNKVAININWTNPNYQFTTGISSQNVNYSLQIDTLGANFSSSKMFTYNVANNLSKSFTVTEINSDLANTMSLATGVKHTVQMRIISSLGSNNGAMLISNTLQFNTTPYAPPPLITPPAQLFIIGDATPQNPAWDNSPTLVNQQFTQVSATEFKITIALKTGFSYLFLPVDNGNWDHKYGGASATGGSLLVDGAVPGSNTPAPSASGTYVIDINFQTGVYTVTPK